ncbi:MAG: hypothetical protein A2175_00725 [Candidatus Nealsonbacteria bacterium RBG_13_42_11]|uniref:alanine--tRNA ligase n=1 Tax=Candidatus Nealsonbacteria bacterium RBG_13_42_11 TaxID=1801663 RepID=A0A1G2DZH8_9BACT|nr:MAG: hypothetical protein A2175_00725 [Candidatus Nealsonbacteria bacterium RBG_13_42_11]
MNSKELREKFLRFFEGKGHKIVPSSSLIPTDPSVLFTTAGMQQFKSYYLAEKSPYGPNAATAQKCFRTSDIEEVGDDTHLTFLEMLGNFSFGGYFKEEAIKLAYEFLFKELKLSPHEAVFTVFEGDQNVSEDKESIEIWKKLGIKEDKIKKCGREDNFWGPTGEEGPCGPTTEIYFKNSEVWNLVFNEYYQDKNKKLTPLKQKGVDTGMGLERLALVVQNKNSVYETDLFLPIINEIPGENEKAKRIISDHVKSSVFLISEGILPSNVERGYVLRRVLRRAIRYGKLLNLAENFLIPLAQKVIEIYQDIYPEVKSQEADILTVIQNEEEKFEIIFEEGLNKLHDIISWWSEIQSAKVDEINKRTGELKSHYNDMEDAKELGDKLFLLEQSYGFPVDLSLEEFEEFWKERIILKEEVIKFINEARKKHQEISRAGAEKKFGGGGEFSPKLHTATHLLHAALRQVLGDHVKQMGSDITSQRLRFDFSHPQKMTAEEIKKVEDLVNEKIKEDLEVKKEEMKYEDALKSGALAFFKEKYPEKVSVYSAGNFSREICAGPHVKKTSELGNFKIIKEESSGAGVRRIRAVLR